MEAIRLHEQDILSYAHQRLSAVEGLKLIGTAPGKSGVVSFTMDCAHPHDISTIIDNNGVPSGLASLRPAAYGPA